LIHGPSLGLGAGIAAAAIVASFLVFNAASVERELVFEPAPATGRAEPAMPMGVFLENGSPVLGDPDAPVTLVEFGDYQCHFCNVFFHETEHAILENYVETGKVRMIFKDFTIIGADSINAAHAAHCAGDQERFWQYHDTLYDNWAGENNGWAGSQNLLRFAQQAGLDTDEFSACMLEARHAGTIEQSNSDARALGLTGTPGFFVIGPGQDITRIGGAQPYEVFERIFDSELEK